MWLFNYSDNKCFIRATNLIEVETLIVSFLYLVGTKHCLGQPWISVLTLVDSVKATTELIYCVHLVPSFLFGSNNKALAHSIAVAIIRLRIATHRLTLADLSTYLNRRITSPILCWHTALLWPKILLILLSLLTL